MLLGATNHHSKVSVFNSHPATTLLAVLPMQGTQPLGCLGAAAGPSTPCVVR